MHTTITPSIQEFFHEFDRASRELDMPAILSEFAENFMYAGPAGTQVIKREQFGMIVAKQKEMFDAFGLESTNTMPVEEYPLDDFYSVVKATVTMVFKNNEKTTEIVQHVSYIVRMGDSPTICFYANPNDVQKLMADAGLAKA